LLHTPIHKEVMYLKLLELSFCEKEANYYDNSTANALMRK